MKSGRELTYRCSLYKVWPQIGHLAVDTRALLPQPNSIWPVCRMHAPNRNRPISVPHSYWLGDFVAWDRDGGHCDCGKRPIRAAIDTWNFWPHPNRFHHSNCRNISWDLDRSARIPVSISYPNVKHRIAARYSYAWAPAKNSGRRKMQTFEMQSVIWAALGLISPLERTLSRQISLSADDGTPSSSSSSRTLFNATISNVSRFFPLKTVP